MTRYRKPKPEREGSLHSLADVLPGLYRDLQMDKKTNEFALLALWPSVIRSELGESVVAQTRAVRIKKQGHRTILQATVINAVLASELSFHLPLLLMALNRYQPQTGLTIDQIQLQVGSLS